MRYTKKILAGLTACSLLILGVEPAFAVAATSTPRQQVNTISAFIDASMVYGSDKTRADALRTFVGGKLKTSGDNLLPLNTTGLPNANDAHIFPDNELFLAGDVRANENVELSAVQTLFVREHNRIADSLAKANSKLSDESLYQQARKLVIAEIEAITYNEFLPALLGPNVIKPYTGYKPDVNPGIANEFSTAAFRIGHTLVNDDVEFLNNDGTPMRDEMELAEAFFNPKALEEFGPDPVLKYLATDNAQEVDTMIVGGLRNFLFGPPGSGGLDLASLNIQRGRDHGLADYNSTRAAYGLPKVKTWSDITSNTELQTKLKDLYGSVNNIDLWVGGLAEDHIAGSSVGPLFQKIIADQFERTRDGDRFWYERTLSADELASVKSTTLSDIIKRNTSLTNLQDNVFYFTGGDAATLIAEKTSPTLQAAATQTAANKNSRFSSFLSHIAKIFASFTTRSYDGNNNNLAHPTWGKANTALVREAPAAYANGTSSPAGANRPSARLISNTVADLGGADAHNNRSMSDWVYAWGQFIDHDLDLTTQGDEAFDISVPKGDVSFDPLNTGTVVIPFDRSNYDTTKATWTRDTSRKAPRVVGGKTLRTFPSFQ